jgi:hypothetical protein
VVAPKAGEEEQASCLQQVQATLDGLRRQGEAWASRGSKAENGKWKLENGK